MDSEAQDGASAPHEGHMANHASASVGESMCNPGFVAVYKYAVECIEAGQGVQADKSRTLPGLIQELKFPPAICWGRLQDQAFTATLGGKRSLCPLATPEPRA